MTIVQQVREFFALGFPILHRGFEQGFLNIPGMSPHTSMAARPSRTAKLPVLSSSAS